MTCRSRSSFAARGLTSRAAMVVAGLLFGLLVFTAEATAQEQQAPPPPPPISETSDPTPAATGAATAAPASRATTPDHDAPPTSEVLRATARAIADWDGDDIGTLFKSVKGLNADKGAIDTIRELNKAIKEKKSPLGEAEAAAISKKLTAAQKKIKANIVSVRVEAFKTFASRYPTLARYLSAVGDVGSWPNSDDINSDVDWTVFGTHPSVTRYFVEKFYNPMLLEALAGAGSGLDLRTDFDIVVTPEGWERKAGVFETDGGKALAKTVMSRVIPINADGTLGTPTSTDVAAELENTKVQARLRQLASEMKVYDEVFDAKGNFRGYGAFEQKQFPTEDELNKGFRRVGRDPAANAAIDAFLEAADEEGLLRYDSKIVRRATLAGTCLDMAKHLHHEAIEKLGTLDKNGQIKRIMKYPGRSEWAYGKSAIPPQWVEDYVVMGDPKMRRLVELSAAFHKAKEAKPVTPKKKVEPGSGSGDADLAEAERAAGATAETPQDTKPVNEALARMVETVADEFPDSHELGRLAETMIIRQAHLAMQVQLEEIVKIEDAATRARHLQALIDDFGVVDEPGPFRAFAQAQKQTLTEFKKISDDPTAFAKLKSSHEGLATLSDPASGRAAQRLRGFLKQTELGGKLLEIHEQAKALADRVGKRTEKITWQLGEVAVTIETIGDHLRESSSLFRLVENAKLDLDRISEVGSKPTADLQSVLDRIGTAVDVLQAIGDAKTDADLAYNLGKALWDNSGVGGIVNTLYAFAIGGDNEAMAKFMMFALCPSAAIPELVAKIGNFAMRTGAQRLFDMQLDALYAASRFAGDPPHAESAAWKGKDPWLLADFAGYGAGVPAAAAFLDDLLQPGGYRAAESMIVARVGERLTDLEAGSDIVMKAAVVKAIWATLMLGDPIVLADDGDLVTATQRIKLITDDILVIAKNLGKEIARTPEFFVLPDGLSKGEQAALNKLVAEREVWVGKARAAMAAAIVRTFEERRRAEADLSDREIERRMEELRALLTRLDVLEPGLYHLGEEGTYNFLQRHGPLAFSTAQQQRKLMTAINRYFDSYSQILSLRDAIAQIVQLRTAAPSARPPLTGAPPLCGERSIDVAAALRLFEAIRKAGETTASTLTAIKGAPLAGPFDARIRRGVDAAAIAIATADADGEIARACRELHWKSEVIDRARFTEDAAASTERLGAAQQRRQALIDEFTAFYAALRGLQPRIVLSPARPVQGEPVAASLTLAGGVAPAEAEWVWTLTDGDRRVGAWRGPAIRFEAPFRGRYRLSAALTLSGVAVKTVALDLTVEGRPGLSLVVVPPDPAPDGAMSAEARFDPATVPAGAGWDWRCEGCTVVAVHGPRAELKAPAKGAGQVRVNLLGGAADKRVSLAEARAPFRVDEAKTPPETGDEPDRPTPPSTPPTSLLDKPVIGADGKTVTGPDGKTVTGADGKTVTGPDGKPVIGTDPTKVKPATPVFIPTPDLSSWFMAMNDRETLVGLAKRPDLSAAEREKVSASILRTEARMKVFWDAAAAETAIAEDYTGKIRAETAKVYDGFIAKGPKALMANEGNITDLEGETVASRNNSCFVALHRAQTHDLGVIDEDLTGIRAIRARFKAYSPERAVYFETMRGWDALTVDHDKTRWKTKGWERTVLDPCDGPPVKVSLAPASVPTVAAAPAEPGAEPAPTVTLALDPASRGRPDATVIATVRDGRAPFAFAWAGAKSNAAERAVYARVYGKGPPVTAEVRVADAVGRTATASLPIEPIALTVQLVKTAPAGSDLPVGAKASFTVRLSSEAGAVDPRGFVLRWEPSTEARFEKQEGPGVVANTATWSRTGKTRVWVVALQRQGGALATVAESEQIELDVTASGIELDALPADPLVGQEVKVTARETPRVADGDASWWWEASGETTNAGPTADPRVYSYLPKTPGPVTVTAHLKEKLHGEELAKAARTITARPFAVSVATLGPAFETSTTRPVVWRPGKGLVTLDREPVPDMDVGFRADITPTPTTPQLRHRWTVEGGATLSGNPAGRETRAKRSDAGPITVVVEVRDANDIVLGTGRATVNVAVSAADLATGRQKAGDLARLKQEATRAWTDGDLDAACRAARAAAEIEPGFAEARSRCEARDRVADLARRAEAGIAARTATGLDEAKRRLDEIRAVNARAKPIAELEKKLAAASGSAADPSAERQRRMDLIVQGATACGKADWTTCRDRITAGLDKGEAVFLPTDAGTIAKARTLRQRAEQALAAAGKTAPDRDASRKQRRDAILAGAMLCAQSRWRECRDGLGTALAGAEKDLGPEDAAMLGKARALLAEAGRRLGEGAKPQDPKSDGTGGKPDPKSATPSTSTAPPGPTSEPLQSKPPSNEPAKPQSTMEPAPATSEPAKPKPSQPTPEQPKPNGSTAPASTPTAGAGHWEFETITYHMRDQGCPVGTDCASGKTWVDQGTRHAILSVSPTGFVFGGLVASGQAAMSNIRVRWEAMPKALEPGRPFQVRFGVDILRPGPHNSSTQAWVYRGPGAGGGQRNLGWLTVADDSAGGTSTSTPEAVPEGPKTGEGEMRLTYKLGASAIAQVDFVYRWAAGAAPATTKPATVPPSQPKPTDPATPPQPKPPAEPPANSGAKSPFDGVYVGTSTTASGSVSDSTYTWRVSGGRFTVETSSRPGVVFAGTIAPTGDFKLADDRRRLQGRIVGDVLLGAYEKLEDGKVNETGTFMARRGATAKPATPPKPGLPTPPKPAEPTMGKAVDAPAKTPAESGRDGVYRGRAVMNGRETAHLRFEITGSEIVLMGEKDEQHRRYPGSLAPDGSFVIDYPNNTVAGRITATGLEGTWRMHKGILGGAGMAGTFWARR